MKLCLVATGLVYLIFGSYFFTIWLKFLKRDTRLSLEDRWLSLVILGIATLLWPIVVPLAYLELLLKPKTCCQVVLNRNSNQVSQ
jgi:hypothetical protein